MLLINKQTGAQSIESYRTPEIKVLRLNGHSLICVRSGDGNDGLYEQDFGDGGFTQQ